MNHPQIVFRADASQTIGVGHVMRCLTLAEVLSNYGWSVGFACSSDTPEVAPQLGQTGFEILLLDASPDGGVAQMQAHWPAGASWLVVDHYGLDETFEREMRSWAKKIMVIDDLADRSHDCDILLDTAISRDPADYKTLVPAHCQMLLGPDFAQLRPQFFRQRASALTKRGETKAAKRVLISLGGTAHGELIEKVLSGIAKSGMEVEVDLILGSGSADGDRLVQLAKDLELNATVSMGVEDMASHMIAADIAIGAPGTTSWERAALGLPALLIVLAENQKQNATDLEAAGAVRLLGTSESISPQIIADGLGAYASDLDAWHTESAAAASLVDGRGTLRTALVLLQPVRVKDGKDLSLRLFDEGDTDIIYEWQSHPDVRRFARNPEIPSPQEHGDWMAKTLINPKRVATIMLHGGEPAGVLRFDELDQPGEFEISILVAPDKHRLGIGLAALKLARQLMPGIAFHAEVMSGNIASHSLFEGAGYKPVSEGKYISRPAAPK